MGSKYNSRLSVAEIPQMGWKTVGTIDSTIGNDAVFGATERDYDTAIALAHSVATTIPQETTTLEVRTIFETDDEDAVIDMWMMRDGDTQMKRVCTLTCKGGAQTIVIGETTYYLADTQTVSNNEWPATPVSYGASADTMTTTRFNADGYSTILFHGHTTLDEDVIVQISGF